MGDDFLSRWSRRRQAVQDSEAPPPIEEREPSPVAPEPPAAAPTAGLSDGEIPGGTAPEAPLPAIDDLTADSDITGFLRHGVPEALKRAALRRAWSLDPAIRDFVGPAEYAWDYNAPGSMAGFGPAPAAGLLAAAVEPDAGTPAKAVVEEIAGGEPARRPAGGISDRTGEEPDAEPALAGPDDREDPSGLPRADPPRADTRQPPAPERQARSGEARPGQRHGGALPR